MEKIQLWDELIDWRRRNNVACWSIVGDFNAVRNTNERKGTLANSSQSIRESAQFNDFILDMELVDVLVTGKKYTWYRPNGSSMSRLDRFLVSMDWLVSWPHCIQQVMEQEFPNHCPVVLKLLNQEWGPKPFRVLNSWHNDPRFRGFVEKSWKSLVVHGNGAFIMKEKLKLLKSLLKQWNSEVFGNLITKRNDVVVRMNALDVRAGEHQLTVEEVLERKELMREYWRLTDLHES